MSDCPHNQTRLQDVWGFLLLTQQKEKMIEKVLLKKYTYTEWIKQYPVQFETEG